MTKKELKVLAQIEEVRAYLIRMYATCMNDDDVNRQLSDGEWLDNFLSMTKSTYGELGQITKLITGED